ncbi:hypothetical protein [Fusobacterium nucleatum]|uniref:Uncharacterized protein n=1 Tax=Fusobacterium nucleatum TaxID=851 RepID=A0A133NZS1_FUSNU|nr:hypothetical protein [Fusobacterium nucleatum]KXA21762.1 hypothetical protein HMPREF3221_01061 [Fusobacterium nucleatum]MCL4582995.1 hypothetical protein [Fusobacterium nucleatum YWH7054]
MKKLVVVLMLVLGVVSFANWTVVSSGEDRESNTNNRQPGVAVLYDDRDGKYDIYRFTMSHGFWADKGSVLDKAALNEKFLGVDAYKVLKYKGKKCINLTEQEAVNILNAIGYRETAGY